MGGEMKYIQRDLSGKINGVYTSPQPQPDGFCLTEPDPFPDDHPEVVAFLAQFERYDELHPYTKEDSDRRLREYEENQKEAENLRGLVLRHWGTWAHLEMTLSGLLQAVLHVQGPPNNVARAVYFSIPGFDQRCITVVKALTQFVDDHLEMDRKKYCDLEMLTNAWGRIGNFLTEAKKIRNAIAHGSVSYVPHGGRHNARITAPLFDPIRVGNHLRKGSNPGIGSADIEKSLQLLERLQWCIDRINESVSVFYQFGPEALPKTRARLEANLQALESLALNQKSA